jgi:glycosyltransferase involved in cell wall biosynthesis
MNQCYRDNIILLTVLIPAYNAADCLEKCIFSLLPYEYPDSDRLEILIVNDGSKDNTLNVATELAERHEQIRIIDKENGGHGSTINAGIKQAKGKYFRIIDSDDWVDSANFIKFLKLLNTTDSDLVLTDAAYEFIDVKALRPYVSYDMEKNVTMSFSDILKKEEPFSKFGPVLASSTYKLCKLQEAAFKITEHSAYVDMEFNAFAIKNIDTIIYFDLDIYRYMIGREGQSVSVQVWMKKYKEHESILFNLIKYIENEALPDEKNAYIINKLIAPMVDSQVFMYDQICKLDELKEFLKKLAVHENIYATSMSYIFGKNGDCKTILNQLDSYLPKNNNGPIIKTLVSVQNSKDSETKDEYHKLQLFHYIKKAIKCILPYGVIRLYQKKKYGF